MQAAARWKGREEGLYDISYFQEIGKNSTKIKTAAIISSSISFITPDCVDQLNFY